MGLIAYLVIAALSGLIVGALGRFLLPGPDPMSIGETILVGLAATFIASIIGYVLIGRTHGGSLIGSVLVAMVIVYILRRVRGGSSATPGGRGGFWR